MVNSSILMLRQNKFLTHWPLEEIRKAKPKDFRLQYFRKGTIITGSRDSMRKLAFVKKGSCNIYRQVVKRKKAAVFIPRAATRATRHTSKCFFESEKEISKAPVFVDEKRLEPGDFFGIDLHFGIGRRGLFFKRFDEIDQNVTLISNGAEVMIFSASFFRAHLNEACNAVLTLDLETRPDRNYEKQLQEKHNWTEYKRSVVAF